jgi:hypothetical protein
MKTVAPRIKTVTSTALLLVVKHETPKLFGQFLSLAFSILFFIFEFGILFPSILGLISKEQ